MRMENTITKPGCLEGASTIMQNRRDLRARTVHRPIDLSNAQPPFQRQKPRAVGSGRLNGSVSLPAYIPAPSNGSSSRALVPGKGPVARPPAPGSGRLFSGTASALDAFRPYRTRRSCPAVPCRTTGRPEAAAPCSSRTGGAFPSGGQHLR